MIWLPICWAIKEINPVITGLFIKGRKINIYFVFITQSRFAVSTNIRRTSTHYFLKKVPNKQELQQIAFNQSLDIDFKDFINLYKKCTAKSYSFLVVDATLAPDNVSCFRKNLVERM